MRSNARTPSMKITPPAKKPSVEKIKSRLVECRRSQRLNFSCLDMMEFPPKFISQANAAGVSNILELDLHSNYISTLPQDLVALQTLRVLKLDHNRFRELPNILFSFLKLQILSVSNNGLKEIDPALGNLVLLRELDVSKNDLTGIPPFYLNMSFLVSLNLAHNRLSFIPDSLGAIRSLQHLDLSSNNLCELPRALQNLEQLVHLDIHGNSVSSLPSTMSHLKMLQKLNCDGNPLQEPERSIYLQGFDNYMGYLRTQHEEEQTIQLSKLRPKAIMEGSYRKFHTSCGSGNWPVARNGHSVCQVNTVTFIFGGFIKKYGKVDELFTIDSRTMIWKEPTTNGCPPCARDGHSATFDNKHCLYFFGGRNDEQKLLNDFFSLDLRSMTWAKPLVDGTLPSIREGAGMVVVGDNVLMFGGQGLHLLYNDIHILDTKTWIWTPISTKGLRPCPRQNVAILAIEDLVYVQGGRANRIFDDMYVLDVSDFIWSKIHQTGLKPRFGHTIWQHKQRFYTTGGFDGNSVAETSLHVLPCDNIKIDRLITNAQATLMLLHEYSSFDVAKNLFWSELECDIKLQNCHTLSYSKENIIVIKTDHHMLERFNVNQYDQVYQYWDIYMEASVENFLIKEKSRECSIITKDKKTRILQRMCRNLQYPKPFQCLSKQEANLYQHVTRYEKSFMQRFPERKPLLLMISNECGTHKLLCSAIRPSITSYTEFFDWEGPTKFLSKYLVYEPLGSPVLWPSYLPSPYSVLEWSRGDCFDFSVTLTSLLTGVGYDAMCVVGLAPSIVTTNNQESVVLAFGDKILTSKPRVLHEVKARQTYKQGASPVLNARYLATLRQSRTLLVKEFVQNFLQSHDERLEKGRTDEQDILLNFIKEKTTLSVMPPNVTSSSESPNDNKFEMDGKDALPPFGRLHCWVMVVAGKRDVTESFFLEPTTGFRYSLKHSPYQYIELVFSPSNVWINVQHKHYSSTGGMNTVSFDFHDSAAWEKLFASDQMRRMKTSEDEESSVNSRILNIMHNTSKPAETGLTVAVLASDETHDILDEKKSMSQSEDLHNNIKTSAVANEATRNYHWILPLSWVPRLLIPMQAFVTRFPNGAKRTFYDRCEHLLFAFYGDYMRYDGLVERVMLFADVERTQLVECHDYFQRRKDKLIKRHYIINDNKVQERFGPGTVYNIKEITTVDSQTQQFVFYPGSRVDGLLTREEAFGQHLIELYDSQDTGLVYQSAQYEGCSWNKANSPAFCKDETFIKNKTDCIKMMSNAMNVRHDGVAKLVGKSLINVKKAKLPGNTKSSTNSLIGKTRASLSSEQQSKKLLVRNSSVFSSSVKRPSHKVLPINQITQRFIKGSFEKSSKERTVYGSKFIQTDFHYINGHMTATSRLYEKNGSCNFLHVDPFQPALEDFERVDEFLKLIVAERDCMQKIRDAEVETYAILQQRANEERNVVILTPYTDIGRYSGHDTEDPKDVTKVESDYLSSFFPSSINPRQHLSRPQMILVRDNCLKAQKERLLRRANIIQLRLDAEMLNLTKKRASFERDREGLTVAEEEEYERLCEKAKFRIRILQQRQKYHEEKTMQKYLEMESKLRNDSRFSRLYEG